MSVYYCAGAVHTKLLNYWDKPMKVLERVLEKEGQMSIDDIQLGFLHGMGTTDSIFLMRGTM